MITTKSRVPIASIGSTTHYRRASQCSARRGANSCAAERRWLVRLRHKCIGVSRPARCTRLFRQPWLRKFPRRNRAAAPAPDSRSTAADGATPKAVEMQLFTKGIARGRRRRHPIHSPSATGSASPAAPMRRNFSQIAVSRTRAPANTSPPCRHAIARCALARLRQPRRAPGRRAHRGCPPRRSRAGAARR